MPTIMCVKVPENIDETLIREDSVNYFSIELAAGFGPIKGKVWKIGALGYSSRKQNVMLFFGAFEAFLLRHHAIIVLNKAINVYESYKI